MDISNESSNYSYLEKKIKDLNYSYSGVVADFTYYDSTLRKMSAKIQTLKTKINELEKEINSFKKGG